MTDRLTPDELDTALDHLAAAGDGAPAWLAGVDRRLRHLDAAFARPHAAPRPFHSVLSPVTQSPRPFPAAPRRDERRDWRFYAIAAVVTLLLAGAFALASGLGSRLTDQDGDDAPIPAAVVDSATDPELIVTPTACTFPPLTRDRYDQAMAGRTPIPEGDLSAHLEAREAALKLLLAPRVVGDRVLITGGSTLPPSVSDEIAAVLAGFLACLNDGDEARLNGLVSAEVLSWVVDPDEAFTGMPATPEPLVPRLDSLRISQARLLDDGRVVVVVALPTNEPELEPGYEYAPEPTPIGTRAIEGHILVFVRTADGWRIDHSASGEGVRIPLQDGTASNSPVVTVAPIVLAPGDCGDTPAMSQEEFEATLSANGIKTPASPQPTNEAGYTAAEEAQRAGYAAMLTRDIRNGQVVFTAGQPADAETARAIAHEIETLLGCLAAGKIGTMPRFFSADYFARLFPEMEWPVDETPMPEDQAALIQFELSQVRVLPDGRVMGVWTNMTPPEVMAEAFGYAVTLSPTPTDTVAPSGLIFVFVNVDGVWLIDAQIGPDAFALPFRAATPTTPQP